MGILRKTGAALAGTAAMAAWLNRKGELGHTLDTIRDDVEAIQERDPAAANIIEALTCYSGLHALLLHRAAHFMYEQGMPVMPRILSQFNRFLTGIEIHPGAEIGKGFFIDHGAGVVIGETTDIGDNVTIGAGAKVLGSVVIGENAKIGAGTIVIHNVPADSTVVGNPGRPVRERGRKVGAADVDWTHLPDPVADAMQSLVRRVVEMENEFKQAFPDKCAEIEKAQEEGERELDRVFDYYHGTGI